MLTRLVDHDLSDSVEDAEDESGAEDSGRGAVFVKDLAHQMIAALEDLEHYYHQDQTNGRPEDRAEDRVYESRDVTFHYFRHLPSQDRRATTAEFQWTLAASQG